MALTSQHARAATVAAVAGLIVLPYAGVADFYLSYLYVVFFWIALATSWGILSGYSGYWSFGHAAFFGAGSYTTATLAGKWGVPFLLTIPAAAAIAAALALGIGWVVFRINTLRAEFFALLTLSVTYVLAAVISNTPLDGGGGVYLSNVSIPQLGTTVPGAIYLLGLALAFTALAVSRRILRSRLGAGLLAIHDDEDVAEVKGVPTLHYKLVAFAVSSAIAGAAGAIQAAYVGYVTVGETFSITVPLYVVLMSILGGARHWAGPAIGATLITVALSLFVGGGHAELGRAGVALALVVVILVLPQGIAPSLLARLIRRKDAAPAPVAANEPRNVVAMKPPAIQAATGRPLLTCRAVAKSFGGIRALQGVDLQVEEGEILALVGPNGSGKSTLINMISGHFPLSSGSIELQGASIDGLAPHEVARRGIARTYQIPRLFNHLTVLENVRLCAFFGGASDAQGESPDELARRWLAFTGLEAKADVLPPALNLHERKFVELARALAARPRLLLLDEVLCGLTPTEVDHAIAMIRKIRAGGTTIVFVEHLMRAVVALADRIAVLDQGTLLALGLPRETMQDPRVVGAYLGTAHAA
ncbi:ATP-binding cassette domain-containing protein [Variovorax sp. J22G21]|uniref:branched-chain amino acid ABC transporter ATP-binding protein/permease n=1 Tax=Variovorax fucosicus TaxID=3053517 RepID=UPI002576FD34|nr:MULTISPECIES: ATP-binding cassette domain-containing protein [unclassified Variovorax]MDM0037857.1 ATP-binding cassette domain-containing protein [Variovorax sp. J22R193]MDM0056474.1 ATP-binding cassette domain-containing protein [Variovorax sp. J22G47]MDM0062633.1 ATP-binding cassette domain-containing protein [Variovorax sp. J22G21]